MAIRLTLVLAGILSIWFLGSGCGGSSPGALHDAAPKTDGAGHDGGEADDAGETDGGVDGVVENDGGSDGGADAGPQQLHRFLSETAGGSTVTSSSYRLELFVAPTRPVGTTQGTSYKLQLGPGAVRAAR